MCNIKWDFTCKLLSRILLISRDNNKDSSDITFSWLQKVNDSVKYGLLFFAATKPSVAPTCTVAGEYKVDSATTVKGKFAVVRPEDSDPTLRLGFGLC